MLLPRLSSPLDDEKDDEEPCDDSELAVMVSSSSLRRSMAVMPIKVRGVRRGRDDQLGITQSCTNLADALSWLEMRKPISGLQRDEVKGLWGTMF